METTDLQFEFSHEQKLIAESVARRFEQASDVQGTQDPRETIRLLNDLGIFEHAILDCVTAVAVAYELGKILAPPPWADMMAASMTFPTQTLNVSALCEESTLLAIPLRHETSFSKGEVTGTAMLPVAKALALLPSPHTGNPGWLLTEDIVSCSNSARTIDESIEIAHAEINNPAREIGSSSERDLSNLRLLLILGEMVGAATACFEKTVEYAKERKQFDHEIGSYQAIKHMAADAAMQLEAMRAAVEYAAWCTDSAQVDAAERSAALFSARSIVGEQAKTIAEKCMQMHGGIAFTWDYGLHRFLKRIVFWRNTAILPEQAGRELAELMAQADSVLENAPLEAT